MASSVPSASTGISPSVPHSVSLQCAHCVQHFPTKTSLRKHMITHLECVPTENPPSCQFCTAPQSSWPDLKRHLSTDHRNFLSCHLCDYFSTTLPELYKHYISAHSIKAFTTYRSGISKHINSVLLKCTGNQCLMCSESFTDRLSLQMHILTSHFKYTSFTCEKCHQDFDSRILLVKHVREKHEVKEVGKLHQDFGKKLSLLYSNHHLYKHTVEKEYVLKIKSSCYQNTESLEKIKSHFKKHHRYLGICDTCGQDLTLLGEQSSWEESAKPQLLYCPSCSMAFSDKSTLCCHMEACDTLRFMCMVCGFISKSESVIKIHVLKCSGNNENNYKIWLMCPCCPKSFTNVFQFREHLGTCFKVTFECPLCQYKCQAREACSSHMRNTHRIKRPEPKTIITCDHCKQQYDSQEMYKVHLKFCFLPVLQCTICKFVTNLEEKIRLHVKTHFDQKKSERENLKKLERSKNFTTESNALVQPKNLSGDTAKICSYGSNKCLGVVKDDSVSSLTTQPEFVDCNDEVPLSMTNSMCMDPLDKNVKMKCNDFTESSFFLKREFDAETVKEERLTPPPLSMVSDPLVEISTLMTDVSSTPNVSYLIIQQNSPAPYQTFTPNLQPLTSSVIINAPDHSGTLQNTFSFPSKNIPYPLQGPQTLEQYPSSTLSKTSAEEASKYPSEVTSSSPDDNPNSTPLPYLPKSQRRSEQRCELCKCRVAALNNRHFVTHHSLSVRCFCSAQLTDVQDMEVHLTQHHNITNTNSILKRILIRTGYVYITKPSTFFLLCPFCDKSQSGVINFLTHLLTNHKNFCRKCGVIFNGRGAMAPEHVAWHSKTQYPATTKTGVKRNLSPPCTSTSIGGCETTASKLEKKDSVQCPLCIFTHENKVALRDHVVGHEVMDCKSCLNSFLVTPRADSSSGSEQCAECVRNAKPTVSEASLHAVTIQRQVLHIYPNSAKKQ